MKENEGMVNCPEQQVILYVEKEDGRYGPVQTGSYITANYLDDYFLKRKNLENDLKQQILRKEISPVKYYMVLEDLTVSELASRMKTWKWRIRKHLLPENFHSIPPSMLQRYASVFNVTVEDLIQPAKQPSE